MSTISNNDIARAIYSFSKDNRLEALPPSGGKASYAKIVEFLARRHLFRKIPDILTRLNKIINHEEGKIMVKLWSAKVLPEKIKKNLVHFLKKRYSAKEIIFDEIPDKKLLGGMRIEVNDEIIDLTIKNKIGELQEYLIRSI